MRPKHRLMAYAKRLPDDRVATATYVPAAEPADIPEFRAAKIYQRDVETFGGSEKCPGCRAAAKGGKYKMSHTFECRQRLHIRMQATLRKTSEGGLQSQTKVRQGRREEVDRHHQQSDGHGSDGPIKRSR